MCLWNTKSKQRESLNANFTQTMNNFLVLIGKCVFPISKQCSVKPTKFVLLGSSFPTVYRLSFQKDNYLSGYKACDYSSASLSQFIIIYSVESYIQLYSSTSHFISHEEDIALGWLIQSCILRWHFGHLN